MASVLLGTLICTICNSVHTDVARMVWACEAVFDMTVTIHVRITSISYEEISVHAPIIV